jgi:hypothetical protein
MTGKKTQKGGVTYHGFIPDTDPRYKSGWNFITGSNLNPRSTEPSPAPQEKQSAQTPKQVQKERELFVRLAGVKQYPIAPDEPQTDK